MSSNTHSSYSNSHSRANDANGRASSSIPKKTNSGTRFLKILVKFLFQIRKATVHFMKFAGVRGVKRVVKTVKLEEDFKSIITLRLGDRVMIKRKIVKELTDRCI